MKKQEPQVATEEEQARLLQTSDAFRETFLFLFDPEDAQVFRQFVDVIEDRLLARSTYGERHPHFSYTLAEMLAVTADLSFLKTFLQNVAAERQLSELNATEQSLAELAERMAPQVAALAGVLEREIEQLIRDDEDGSPAGES